MQVKELGNLIMMQTMSFSMKALAKSCKHSELIPIMSWDLKSKYSVSSYIANSSPESTLYYSPPFAHFDNGNEFFNTFKK